MKSPITMYNIYVGSILLILCLLGITINFVWFRFPGNIYFPPVTLTAIISLLLMHKGFLVCFGQNNYFTDISKELIYFFIMLGLIILAATAAQYTPFATIDSSLIKFERVFHIEIGQIVTWTGNKPLLKKILKYCYQSLELQLICFPLLVILTREFDVVREYYFLLLTTALIGFLFYYFFPTTAPASIINSPYFDEAQRATGLKFFQIHHYIKPTTLEGGLVSLPSFHVIWAWLCLYLVRYWRIVFTLFLPINALIIASCVLLGWHYLIDVIGSLLVIIIAHRLYAYFYMLSLNRNSFRQTAWEA